jgi:hypothetical protein
MREIAETLGDWAMVLGFFGLQAMIAAGSIHLPL